MKFASSEGITRASFLCVAFALAALTGCNIVPPDGKLELVQTTSTAPRAGNAYLLRGWIGIFSEGIDALTGKINTAGVRANVYQDTQWASLARQIGDTYRGKPDAEPLVLIGHSYGADDVIRIARELKKDNITVDLLVTLDPVTPPKVPSNVIHAVNLYQSNGVQDAMPFLRGVKVAAENPGPRTLQQWDIRKDRTELLDDNTNHFNVEKKPKIHDEVLRHVLATCPPRDQWTAQVKSRHDLTAAPAKPVSILQTDATGGAGDRNN